MAITAAKKSAKDKIPVKEQDLFTWQGVNRKGKKVNGELPANNIIELKVQLRKQGITPSRLRKKPNPYLVLVVINQSPQVILR
jgi:type IV pilus assembly protein PilC